MKKTLIPLGLILSLLTAARADYNPISLTPGSYNADVVVEKTAPQHPLNSTTTATMDGGIGNTANTWFEQGRSMPGRGIPAHGTTFGCVTNADHLFTMPPDYTTKDALLFYQQVPNATLTLATPAAFNQISLLNAGGGTCTVQYTIHHQGGGTETGTFTMRDWNDTSSGNVAWYAAGRINKDTGVFGSQSSGTSGPPRLFFTDISLTDQVNPVTSIDFTQSSLNGNRCVIFALSGQTTVGGKFNPVAVTGFNYDMIVEANALLIGTDVQLTSVTMSQGIYNFQSTFYEIGFDRDAGYTNTGLPNAGASLAAGDHTWTMAPDYRANDVLFVSGANPNGTFTLVNPTAFSGLSLLDSAGNGPVTNTVTVHHADSTTESFTVTCLDWFYSSADPTAVYSAAGRFSVDSSSYAFDHEGNTSIARLYKNDIVLANTTSPVTSVDVAYAGSSGSGNVFVFALAGQTGSGGTFNPVAVTGYNQDGICEAASPVTPNGKLYLATTASMDGGANNTGNTWYEQGYNAANPTTGLPAAGSSITSSGLPDHHYQMPSSYLGNDAIFVDTNHETAVLTPVAPAPYSSLSFLASAGNGWVSNACIIQHADGTQETNSLVVQNWFNNSSVAYTANGRLTLDTVTFDSVNSGNPRLYDVQFGLANVGSPVTNIIFKYLGAQSTNGTMVVFAVSGATGGVAPIIQPQPISQTVFEGTNLVLGAGISGGTTPISLQWYVSTSGTWSALSDGGHFSGSKTSSLNIGAINWTNAANYELVASNVLGCVTSAVATVTVLSSLPDVAQRGDPIVNLVGYTDSMGNAIDDTTSKYLTSGTSGVLNPPFTGPVGFVLTPSIGRTTVSALRFYTANDEPERDPMDYTLEGSTDGGNSYTTISSGSLNLPLTRNASGLAISPLTQALQEVRFSNTNGYDMYRMTFNNVRDDSTANSMQIGEIEFLGTEAPYAPVIAAEPPAQVTVFAGASPSFYVGASGYPSPSYQWYVNGALITGATNDSYTLANAQSGDTGKSFTCTIQNSVGATNTTSAALTVIAPPAQAYPAAVLADHPAGFWRLDEGPDDSSGDNGVIAHDYAGGHNGIYSNAVLNIPGYNPALDPDTAAQFGYDWGANSYVGDIQGVDFTTPTNNNTAFSVEAWVQGLLPQAGGAGIVTKGPGQGEQFAIDCGGNASALRFYFRDAGRVSHAISANGFSPSDNKWHHIVAVLDEYHTNQSLYIDGRLAASAALAPGLGVAASSAMNIGARQSATNSIFDLQFAGNIDDVAVYATALGSAQVLAHYYAGGPAPLFTEQPTNTTAPAGTSVRFYSQAYGPGTLAYQWYQSTDYGYSFQPMAGMTSSNLALVNVAAALDQSQYEVVASDSSGSVTSSVAVLTVSSGPPVILPGGDLPATSFVYAGRAITLSVSVGGSAPFTYIWQRNGQTIADDARTSGSESNVLTILNAQPGDSASYQVLISNGAGGPVLSTGDSILVSSQVNFNADGQGDALGWTLNGQGSVYNNAVLLTDNTTLGQATSLFMQTPMYVGAFGVSFVYQDIYGGGADGAAFVVQNDSRGASALGGGGGGMGYGAIKPSVAVQFNIYSGSPGGVGIGLGTNGNWGTPYQSVDGNGALGLDSGNPIAVTILYAMGTMQVSLSNQITGVEWSTSYHIDLPATVGGDTAYVGVTGGDGGVTSAQQVSGFNFVPYAVLSAQVAGPNTLRLSWPASIGGYGVQSKSGLTGGTWQTVSAPTSQANGQNQVTVPVTGGAQFYRLMLQ